jgi:hypothetical protein
MRKFSSKTMQSKSGSIAAVVWLRDWRRRLGTRMHRKQLGSADVLAFPLKCLDDGRPGIQGDTFPLAPLGDDPMTLVDVSGHLGVCVPAGEQISKVFHTKDNERYKLSRQARAGFPVTGNRLPKDNSGVGRAKSPVQFNKDIAERTKAARIAAGYGSQQEFAKALGVDYERYKKWESGRTPIQHEYIPRFYELTGKDANYLFDIRFALSERERERERRTLP